VYTQDIHEAKEEPMITTLQAEREIILYAARSRRGRSRTAELAAEQFGGVCIRPDCLCPFDAPADPNWCAKGLPKRRSPNAGLKPGSTE
jgi:hypothetical protein